MKFKLSVFYHIWSPADTDLWKFLVDEQIKRLYRSMLHLHADIYCAISGPSAQHISNFVSLYDWIQILEVSPNDQEFEGLTLKKLYEHVCDQPEKQAVMYFHTKGISHMSGKSPLCNMSGINNDRMFRSVNSWRHQMEWGVIDQWQEALGKLNDHHVAGVNYCLSPWPHMSGNFWWARADYIRTLEHPTLGLYKQEQGDFGLVERMKYEKWIGTNQPKCFSLHNVPFSYDTQGIEPDIAPQPFEPQNFWLYRDDIGPHFNAFVKAKDL